MSFSVTIKKTPYPVITVLAALLLLAYFYVSRQADLIAFYRLPHVVFFSPFPEILLLCFAGILLLEMHYIQRRRQHQQAMISKVKQQMDELLENRKQLNAKAHVYAGHADKLKLFISDKLLEYIEYDEKFLHFKSIASEVRHNGVICYDRIQTALEEQIGHTSTGDSDTRRQLEEARGSLQYLWDLLDLSTADNIALHIANQVCESEELCFQSELNEDAVNLPDKPLFDPGAALISALERCFDVEPEADEAGNIIISNQPQVWIQCGPADPLLGNENHIILALENLINNAQFYSGRRGSRQTEKRAGIAITLEQTGDYVCYRVYNRGPHIDEDTALKLFQLGYSTRRAREHHGKGLGLYFVNEIVKGYDGRVRFDNIFNRPDVLSLRLELDNGQVITDVIEVIVAGDEVKCRLSGAENVCDSLCWEPEHPLCSVEITHRSDQATRRITAEQLQQQVVTDPGQPAQPRWQLDYQASRKNRKLSFRPLDVAGVQFDIKLPTFHARVEGNLPGTSDLEMADEVESLSRRFAVPDGAVVSVSPERAGR